MILCFLILYQALNLFNFLFFSFLQSCKSLQTSFSYLQLYYLNAMWFLQLSTLFPTKRKQKWMKRTNIFFGFLLSSTASRAYIPSQCSHPSGPPLLLFKISSICKLLFSPRLSWFSSKQNLFTKSVQLLMVVLSFIFLLPPHTLFHQNWLTVSLASDFSLATVIILSLTVLHLLSIFHYSQNNRIGHVNRIEKNRMGRVGRNPSGSSGPISLLKQGHSST